MEGRGDLLSRARLQEALHKGDSGRVKIIGGHAAASSPDTDEAGCAGWGQRGLLRWLLWTSEGYDDAPSLLRPYVSR